MKNVITFLMCSLSIITGIAQSDLSGNAIAVPERTPALEALYQQAKALEQNGSAAEINANRIAIKNAWQEIDPNVAALYKPIVTNRLPETIENLPYNGVSIPSQILERDGPPESPEDWGTDHFLRDDYIDGVDMDVTGGGDIYIGAFEQFIDFGGTFDSIYIYRSTNQGRDFDLWKKVGVTAAMRKMQIISMDGSGDNYLLAYLVTDSENFQVWRWNMATGAFDAQVIASGVTDFGVDRNYPGSTSSQRVFATYEKTTSCTEVHSARSTAGSYGFDWIDEVSTSSTCGQQVEFSYGLNGGCYTTFTGAGSGNLYAQANSNYNDPASWGARETIVDGASTETLNPTIRATRKDFATDEVLILGSSRVAGSSDSYTGQAYRRESGAAYVPLSYIGAGSDANIAHIDTWMSKVGVEIIEIAYVRDDIDDSENDLNRVKPYDGSGFGPFEGVGDTGLNVFDGFASVVAETSDQLPCLAFAGTSGGGAYGYGLYYDAKSDLSVGENSFEGFKFYPNPAQNVLNLSTKNTIENVSMFSLLGQKVFETSVGQNETSINIASLSPGVYIMKVMIGGNSATYKIIKQ
jgi:hypothetical protein